MNNLEVSFCGRLNELKMRHHTAPRSAPPGQYFASIMIIVGMSVIATVVVLQYHHHDPNGGNMPKWVSLSRESEP